ncbi:MAG: TonB-dependent receptor, partial [Chitinophagaceae bacterium]
NITWERTFESNTGLDVGFLKNKFSLTVEYYDSTTDKLLYNQAAQSFTGSNEFINNAGKVRNRGIEIEFSSVNLKTKNFNWSSTLTFSANRNKRFVKKQIANKRLSELESLFVKMSS